MNNIKLIFILALALLCVSCQTVTMSPIGKKVKYSSSPDYHETKHFFVWGLIGQEVINVKKICKGRAAAQIQTQHAFLNLFLHVITIGIYSPRTVKIWCTA